ncbi:hypothetical protein NQK81_02160 [Amycolatopsis roodepoortensis]|uniref:hypothetical protein n=1 Tax=Amycolatopsis roodepoortensis TaxID=700274 RepID=UPI00214B564F|nr:hypothetical protein [Amycolatopsis roodepoortensis]UUV32278.1 hypothetical protein NQK81_02160 [Amycolatopsis roodepoortensis]
MTGDADMDRDEQGPSPTWTLWSSAYAYAQVMRELMTVKLDPAGERAEYFDVPTMLVAYALAKYAEEEGIEAARPSDLADLSGMALWERLETPRLLASLASLSLDNQEVVPAAGEPAHELFVRMKSEVDRAARPTSTRSGGQRQARTGTGKRSWFERGEDGQAFVANMLMSCVSPADRARGVTSLRAIVDKAEGAETEVLQYQYSNPRSYELSEYMAPDEPLPPRGSAAWGRRGLRAALSGHTLLMHYLSSIQDRDFDPSFSAFLSEPRKPGEPETAQAEREQLAKKVMDLQMVLADHAPEVAEELLRLRPSDSDVAVEAILHEARRWWTTTGYDATIDDLLPAMTVLLDGLVVPERREDVQKVLQIVTSGGNVPLDRARNRIRGSAADQPFEAAHLAAAFTAALWQQPACVPDPDEEYLRLATAGVRLAEGKIDTRRDTATPASQPQPSARKADVRKKAARKASRKSRRQGRR